jgi:hypothetical protein
MCANCLTLDTGLSNNAVDETPEEAAVAAQPGQLETAEIALRFMRGGNATVTCVSVATGTRFTYKLRASDDGRITFVSVLTGNDNTSNYAYFGFIKASDSVFVHGGRKAKVAADASSAKAFAWVWAQLTQGKLSADKLKMYHEGRCGRCGRKLTVPSSITTGFGPECAGRVGL